MTTYYRKRLRALQSVDRMVKQLVDSLSQTGELSNTYIVFTSDNGFYFGEHRLGRSELVLNNDLAPTFASWAGVTPPSFVDGRPLAPLLSASPPPSWRSAILIEHKRVSEASANVRAIPNYFAVRMAQYLYVEYPGTGEKELYDLGADPYQLTNIYKSADPALVSNLKARLDALKTCTGTGPTQPSCEAAEGR